MPTSPVSTKTMPPIVVDPRIRRRQYHVYIFFIWLDLLPASLFLYWVYYPEGNPYLLRQLLSGIQWWELFLITPPVLSATYILTVVWTAFTTKIHIKWLNMRHPPREGLFLRDLRDKDYVYWNKRNFARLFLYYLLYSTPIGFKRIYFTYNFFGTPIGKGTKVLHAWISPEFIEIGNNVRIAPGAAVYSFMFENDKLLVAKITIEDDVQIGPQAVVLAGSVLKRGVVLEGGSFIDAFSRLDESGIYSGTPAVKKKE